MYKTIVVQVDDHPRMEARLRAAAWLANAYDAHLVGSAATGLSWPAYALLSGSMAAAPGDEYGALRAGGRASLARFAERARRLGVQSLEERLVERTAAAPGEALLGLARAGAAGLLVSGAFGRSRYRELVLGGVTRSLVRHAAARRKRAGTSRADAPA